MQQVTVKRSELLERLETNRSQHRDLFLKAQDGYRAQVVRELEAMLKEARDGKRIRRTVQLQEPVDQTREYDRAIAMLSMSVDDVIELSARDFQCYVLDQWDWADDRVVTCWTSGTGLMKSLR